MLSMCPAFFMSHVIFVPYRIIFSVPFYFEFQLSALVFLCVCVFPVVMMAFEAPPPSYTLHEYSSLELVPNASEPSCFWPIL